MEVREKLVQLIAETIELYPSEREELADGLIANGVTVQEWISVKDRMPGDFTFVLVVAENCKRVVAVALYVDYKFYTPEAENTQIYVTHWMPLPEPPKGE